jgi:hypothetical protein
VIAAEGFDQVHAHGSGGHDTAQFHDSSGADTFSSETDWSLMRGTDFYNRATDFEEVLAVATTGRDTARLGGSNHRDVFSAWADHQQLQRHGSACEVRGFDITKADGRGSTEDVAYLYTAPAPTPSSTAPPQSVWEDESFRVEMRRFGRVSTRAPAAAPMCNADGPTSSDLSYAAYLTALDQLFRAYED